MIQAQLLVNKDQQHMQQGAEHGLVSIDQIAAHRQRISTNTWALLMVIAYLIIGLLFYCFVDDLSALDSIYLSIITFLTIGYGTCMDLHLQSIGTC
jgi:hypothetical protein